MGTQTRGQNDINRLMASTSNLFHSNTEDNFRPAWNLSPHLNSKSHLSKQQEMRASWLMSRWSTRLPGPTASKRSSGDGACSRSSSNSSSTSSSEAPAKPHGAQTQLVPKTPFKTVFKSSDLIPIMTSLSEVSSPPCSLAPRTPAVSEASYGPARNLPRQHSSPSSVSHQHSDDTESKTNAPKSSAAQGGQLEAEHETKTPVAAICQAGQKQKQKAKHEAFWAEILRLVRLIECPPTIDLVPLRQKHLKSH